MKKLLLMMIVMLVSGAMMAQGSTGKLNTKSFLAFHGGPSFTVGDFGSRSQNNDKAGFAKTGFNLNLNYGYQFSKNAGLTGTAFYNRYNLDKAALEASTLPGANADHWQLQGLAVGPMLIHQLTPKVVADLRVMGGVAHANLPKGTFDGTVVSSGDWKWTSLFQGGLDLRFNSGGRMFIFTNADYMWMQPEFKSDILPGSGGGTITFHQTISVINLTGGVGFKF
jgi:hypothetical protein